MEQSLLSVGIDIGTATTQVVFSRLTVAGRTGGSDEWHITEREIVHRGTIHFTPLRSPLVIDAPALADIIQAEYAAAGFTTDDIQTGAVIITGETARKENAAAISGALSLSAGKFVVATAGPELEGILAGQGSGAAAYSETISGKVINFDIGGGTTNAAVFCAGKAETAFALDIGGRLVRFEPDGTIARISERILPLIGCLNLPLVVGRQPRLRDIYTLCREFAAILIDYCQGGDGGPYAKGLLLSETPPVQKYSTAMFSGGVAEYVYRQPARQYWRNVLTHQDIGVALGGCIRQACEAAGLVLVPPKEAIRATVIGAGVYSMTLSGSTVSIDSDILPLRDVPILKLAGDSLLASDTAGLHIAARLAHYGDQPVALAFAGPRSPSYAQLKTIASQLAAAFSGQGQKKNPAIIVIEHDFAKALGQTIRPELPAGKKLICLDRIAVSGDSFIDIGRPLGDVLPVVVKTLAFR